MSLQSVRQRRHAVESVRDVVSAMRATAAGRIQAAQRAMATAQTIGTSSFADWPLPGRESC